MGMFTTIIASDGRSCQIKTGWDNCDTYKMGDKIPWKPDSLYPGEHIDGVYLGFKKTDNDTIVVIKNCTIIAMFPRRWDRPTDIQIDMLKKEYGITPPDRLLWSEEAWAEKEAHDKEIKERREEWDRKRAHYTPREKMAAAVADYLKWKMNEPSMVRRILPPKENMGRIKGYQIRFDGPPSPEGPRFIEVEDRNGKSISVGRWEPDGNGHWLLIIDDPVTIEGPQIPCPRDTDGDGNCGQPACPHCGPSRRD